MNETKSEFMKCILCEHNLFRIRVTSYGQCASDHEWICARCGTENGGVFNDPLNEIPPEIFGRPEEEKVEIPPELMNMKTMKMLRALDHPIRLAIVNFILSQRGKNEE